MTAKRYVYKTLGFLGQMYEQDGEEANYIVSGSMLVLASDYDALAADLMLARAGWNGACDRIAVLEAENADLRARVAKALLLADMLKQHSEEAMVHVRAAQKIIQS